MRRVLVGLLVCGCVNQVSTDGGTLPDGGPSDGGFDGGEGDDGGDMDMDSGTVDAGPYDAGPPTVGACGATDFAYSFGDPPDSGGIFTEEFGQGVSVDALGNSVITGGYRGPTDFGGGPVTDPGANLGMFVAWFSPDGGHLWSRGFADPSIPLGNQFPQAQGLAVVQNAAGDIFVAGAFAGTIDFGTGFMESTDLLPDDAGTDGGISDGGSTYVPAGCLAAQCATDMVVMRMDSSGTTRWVRTFGLADSDSAAAIALDSVGQVYVAGAITGDVDFGAGPLDSLGGRDVFVLALDGDGGFLWARNFGGSDDDIATSIAVNDSGILIGGFFQELIDFGGGIVFTSFGVQDAFAAMLNPTGTGIWANRGSIDGHGEVAGVGLDSQGNAWVAGTFRGNMDGGFGRFTSQLDDVFLTKLSPTGAILWAKSYGGSVNDAAFALTVSSQDHVFVTGNVAVDPVDFGGGPLSAGAGDDLFVFELDAMGVHQCSRRYPSPNGGSTGRAIAVDATGDSFVAGGYFGILDVGTGPMETEGHEAILFTKFSSH